VGLSYELDFDNKTFWKPIKFLKTNAVAVLLGNKKKFSLSGRYGYWNIGGLNGKGLFQ